MLAHPAKLWRISTDLFTPNGYRYGAKMSTHNRFVPLEEPQRHVINPTNPGGALYDGIEDRLHVGGRAADDAEHFSRCCLVLQGFAQFRITFLQLVKQPDILDRDHSLIGKGCH